MARNQIKLPELFRLGSPAPWTVEELEECFVVTPARGYLRVVAIPFDGEVKQHSAVATV
jgi:hypothetical protein